MATGVRSFEEDLRISAGVVHKLYINNIFVQPRT